jgi:DnaD/phage-associated family protein
MTATQIALPFEAPYTEIPHTFIDRHMNQCLPVYALIYIYGFRNRATGFRGTATLSLKEQMRFFSVRESDILNAWNHWEQEGLVSVNQNGDELTVRFMPVAEPAEKTDNPPSLLRSIPSERPTYTVEELAVYRRQSRDIEQVFNHAEQTLGKLLTYNDMNALFGFYDWLCLPVDVIQYLLTYCAEQGHRHMRYIEKAALDWAENNIDDLEKALIYVQSFDRDYRAILKAMGQTSGYPSPSQRKYIDKWLHTWQMPLEMVMEACDRAAMQIGKPKFTYVDKIIEDWHKKNLCTVAEAEQDAADYRKKIETAKPETKKRKKNRFVNFDQRDRDYQQLEKMEREYLTQKLKGI